MKKQTLDKQDRWLINKWPQALQFESAMDAARAHYEELLGEVHQRVRKAHPELDRFNSHFKRHEVQKTGGQILFSKSAWPCAWPSWPTSITIWGISLDELTGNEPITPDIHIWLGVRTQNDPRTEKLTRALVVRAPHVFGNRRLLWQSEEEDDRVCLWYPLPEGQSGLLKLLLKDNGRPFVDCLVGHVQMMTEFIPVLDKVLLKGRSR